MTETLQSNQDRCPNAIIQANGLYFCNKLGYCENKRYIGRDVICRSDGQQEKLNEVGSPSADTTRPHLTHPSDEDRMREVRWWEEQ